LSYTSLYYSRLSKPSALTIVPQLYAFVNTFLKIFKKVFGRG